MRALIMTAEEFEDLEFFVPYYRLLKAGAEVVVASLAPGAIRGKHGYTAQANAGVDERVHADFDLVVLPGGRAPAALREKAPVQAIARHFMDARKPVAAICHGPQILVSAGVMEGRSATCFAGMGEELDQAGADYRDEPVVVDANLVTARTPPDLPLFVRAMMEQVRE